jgi:hypothetical protein
MVFIFWSPIPKKDNESTPEISIFFFRTSPNYIKNSNSLIGTRDISRIKISVS